MEIQNYEHKESSDTISYSIALIIQDLWTDKGIKTCYDRRNELQIVDSANYFLDNVHRISADDFIPNEKVSSLSNHLETFNQFLGHFNVSKADNRDC